MTSGTVEHRPINGTIVFPLDGNIYTIELTEVGTEDFTLLLEDVNAYEIQSHQSVSRRCTHQYHDQESEILQL